MGNLFTQSYSFSESQNIMDKLSVSYTPLSFSIQYPVFHKNLILSAKFMQNWQFSKTVSKPLTVSVSFMEWIFRQISTIKCDVLSYSVTGRFSSQ